jgi:glycosyltransferase involved in cell wall biosynthesis
MLAYLKKNGGYRMRILIPSTNQNMTDYSEFVEALASVGVDAMCVQSSRYCYLGETRPLHIIPTPKLLKIIKEFNPDFILTDSPYYISRIAKLVGRRLLFHMVGHLWSELYYEGAMLSSFFSRTYTRYLTAITGLSIKEIDLILPISKWLEKQVKEHLQNCPTRVLYMGINPRKWDPKGNARSILTIDVKHPAAVGVFPFNIYPKVLGLLKFTRAIRKMRNVNFYFAGDGPYMDLVRQERPPNMFLVGRVSGSDVKEFLESGDVFVHPSGLDALPRSVKEAALMEKPIVASNEGGIPEIVKDGQTGYLCDINNTDQWTNKIRFLLDNPDVCRRLGKNAREFVTTTFDWRRIAEGFVKNL